MTSHWQGSNPLAQANNQGDGDNRKVFQTARRDDRDLAIGPRRVASNGNRHFYGNDRGSCPRVDGQAEHLSSLGTFQEAISDQDLWLKKEIGSCHGLKGQGVTSRKAIVRVGNQGQFFMSHHCSVDLVPVFAVGQKITALGNGNGRVHLLDPDQQPLPVKSLSDLFDRLAFHNDFIIS